MGRFAQRQPLMALVAAYALALQALLAAWSPVAAHSVPFDLNVRCLSGLDTGSSGPSKSTPLHDCTVCIMSGCGASATLPDAVAGPTHPAPSRFAGAALIADRPPPIVELSAQARAPPVG